MLIEAPVRAQVGEAQAARLMASPCADSGAATAVPAIARFLPSLTDVAFLMPLAFLFMRLAGTRTLLADGDTGWHLRTGEWILNNHQVPVSDMFSFSRPGAPWFAWEWLWDTAFALLFRFWGMPAVILGSTLVISLTSVALFRLIRRKCDNGLVAIAVTLLATGGCAVHWLARPHLFTLLFFTLSLHIADRADQGNTKLLAWLVPLTLVWTNLHGGFFVVFLVLACYVGAGLINAAIEPSPAVRRGYLLGTLPWLKTAAACFAVTFINPYGWELHKHILAYFANPYMVRHVAEFQGLDFHSPAVFYFEPLIVLAVAAAVWAARERRFADVLLTVGWLHLALIMGRNLPLFAIAASPVIGAAAVAIIRAARSARLQQGIAKLAVWFQETSAGMEQTDRIRRVHFVSAAAFLMLAALLFSPAQADARFVSTYDPQRYPEKALPVLAAAETHRIFASDQWGDYLIYRLAPATKVFFDGRSDFYGSDFGEEYLRVINGQEGWNRTLDRYSIDTVAVPPSLAITSILKVSRDWRVVYDDHYAIVFRRNNPATGSFVSDGDRSGRDLAITKQQGS